MNKENNLIKYKYNLNHNNIDKLEHLGFNKMNRFNL